MQGDKHYHTGLLSDRAVAPGDVLRWLFAAIMVFATYAAAVASFYGHGVEPERLAGSAPAIMLEFAAEPTAPDVEASAQTIQSGMQADDPLPQAEPETHLKPETSMRQTPAPSELVETTEPAVEHKPEKNQDRPDKPPENKQRQKRREKLRENVAKGRQNQKSLAPDVVAKSGKTFAGRINSRSEGFNGQSDKAWADRVYRKIQSVGRRMQRQLPGARGVAYVFFAYDASGRISAANIARSSGDSKLDQLALRIVEHSSPLPTPPDAGSNTVPVRVN